MRSGQIQQVIAHGVPPFALCGMVSRHIRSKHKRGGHIQDSIVSVFGSLTKHAASGKLGSVQPRRMAPQVLVPGEGEAMQLAYASSGSSTRHDA